MTENEYTNTDDTNRAMTTVDHTHPDTDRPFGERVTFERGPTVAADGGDAGAADETASADDDAESEVGEETEGAETMRDVAHVPPADAEPNRVFERGYEGRDGDR